MPLQQKGGDQEVVTQFAMQDVEALGLLKMDFLGLRNLDVIDEAIALIGGDRRSPRSRSTTRRRTRCCARGESTGVFQFESSGMREALRQVKPTEFEDLIALVALFRPGPMGYIPVYARRKAGQEQVTFADERLRPITGSTYGICIYQEQYMEIAKQLAGFSPAEADDLRKAIGKKIHSLMASLQGQVHRRAVVANEVEPKVAEQLWKDMEQAQDYSFNKSHAACYALIAYRTAYLKANYPAEYMAALISSVMNTKDKVPFYVAACEEMGIEVLPPDVNVSALDFAVVEGKIRFGLNAVKNVGETAARAIVAAARRSGGPFVVALGLLRARRSAGGQQAGAREPRQVRGARLDRARRGRGCSRCSSRRSRGAAASRPTGSSGRGRSSTSASTSEPEATGRGTTRRSRPRSSRRRSCSRSRRSRSASWVSRAPAPGPQGAAAAQGRPAAAEVGSRRDGDVVTVGGIVGARSRSSPRARATRWRSCASTTSRARSR